MGSGEDFHSRASAKTSKKLRSFQALSSKKGDIAWWHQGESHHTTASRMWAGEPAVTEAHVATPTAASREGGNDMADESTAITTEIPVIAPSIGAGRTMVGRPVASNPAARVGKLVTAAEILRRGNSSTVKIVPTTAPAAQAVELQKPQETHQLQELWQTLRTRQAQQSQAVVRSEAANSSN